MPPMIKAAANMSSANSEAPKPVRAAMSGIALFMSGLPPKLPVILARIIHDGHG
jgi:hypothetical protein